MPALLVPCPLPALLVKQLVKYSADALVSMHRTWFGALGTHQPISQPAEDEEDEEEDVPRMCFKLARRVWGDGGWSGVCNRWVPLFSLDKISTFCADAQSEMVSKMCTSGAPRFHLAQIEMFRTVRIRRLKSVCLYNSLSAKRTKAI